MRAVVLFLLLAVTSIGAAPAQELGDDVAGIRQTLDRLVVLLENVEQQKKAELLLRRIELGERRLAPLQERLRSAESEVEGLESEISRMRTMKEQFDEEFEKSVRAGEVADSDRMQLDHFEREIVAAEERLETARYRARSLEDELAEGRDEIEVLDEKLLEMLGEQ